MTVSHMNDIASVSKPQVQESADKSDARVNYKHRPYKATGDVCN